LHGREAIETWSTRCDENDLLLTDIVMPIGLRGNLLADRLQAEKAGLKVTRSSGYNPRRAR
jgi:hypothetical protein